MNHSYHLVPFWADARPPVQDLAQLHRELLPTSPVALLGDRFMKRFYYMVLPRENLICGAVAYVDNQPAGFIVATHDSNGFMRKALRRYWLYLIWVIGTSVLLEPKRLGAVWEAFQIMKHRTPAQRGEEEGEILSFGVLPPYLSPRFIRQSGLQLSTDLLKNAIAQLSKWNVPAIRAVVDADNTPAKLFYHGLGWSLDRSRVPGWRTPSVEFLWRL